MNYNKLLIALSFVWLTQNPYIYGTYDLTIVSSHIFHYGIGRRAIGLIQMLQDSVKINYVDTRPKLSTDKDIDPSVLDVIRYPDKGAGTVAYFADTLFADKDPIYLKTPDSKIKIAFVTLESTAAPDSWVYALNNHFDATVVPDIWLVDTLKRSGVKIPIFVLPERCYLEDFLKIPLQENPHYPFVFGITALSGSNKNYELLLEAFAAAFKNSPDVVLKIQNSWSVDAHRIHKRIRKLDLQNVIIHEGPLSWNEYVHQHMNSIDCYVLFSLGEGFSITPREALALGRPCILSNHTAHKTICNTGFVKSVEPTIIQPHDGQHYAGISLGYNFNCKISCAAQALKDVYNNYSDYLKKAAQGKEWVKQYLACNLKSKYLSLFKPQKVILGDRNEATDSYLMTDSKELYKKYVSAMGLN